MGELIRIAIAIACVALPFAMMPLLWRRMKRVRVQSHARSRDEDHHQPAWEEATSSSDGRLTLTRPHAPNDALIALGEHGRQSRWPIDNG